MASSIDRHQWVILFLCTYSNFVLVSVTSAFGPILPIIKGELKLSYTEGGMFTTAYFVGYTMGQIPWGYFADKFGGSKAITISILASSIATLLSGTITSIGEVILWRFLSGLLGAGVFASGIRVISELFPQNRRGSAIGLLGAGSSLASIFVAFTFPLVVISYSWRWCIWILSTLGFIDAIVLWVMLRNELQPKRTENTKGDMKRTIFQQSFWLIGYSQFVRLGINYALGAWLPTFLYEYYGLSLIWAGIIVTIMSLVGIFSNLAGGVASDRFGEIPVILSALIVFTPSFFVLAITKNLILALILIFLLGWCVNFLRSPLFAVLPKLYGLEVAGRATGFQNTYASAGALLFPFIIGYSRDNTSSFSSGWMYMGIFCGVSVILTLLLQHLVLKQIHK